MSDTYGREEELFAAVLDRPPAERARFLDTTCSGEPALRARLEALLAAHDSHATLSDAALAAVALGSRDPFAAEDAVGARIGPYRLAEKIGEGGVGTVYRAEQEEPVRRAVALKVIKLGMDTREVIARFAAERQALALMDHPHIAHVFDAGATASGRPFFAMELVRGLPITRYCDEHRLGLEARLELFVTVCAAVQHAHTKGIIHRDLKPSNILVAEHDGRPLPKVIDFGIAKATGPALAGQTLVTAVAQFVGTPAYMSPEQAGPDGTDLDTRSDVFSLGVLLCELLAGRTPFAGRDLKKSGLDEIRRRIREDEPQRPSALLAACDPESRRAADRLRGELDWIVLRCLEKDRTRRYPTANALAEDLRRYLDHEPVSAVAPSALYTLRKFARRYRVAFAAGLAIAFTLLAATGVSAWLAVRATRAERVAEARRAEAETQRAAAVAAERRAETEAASSRAITDFLRRDLLAQASPESQPERDVKLRTVLDRAASRIEGRFPAQPLVEAALRDTLGDTYTALGEHALQEREFAASRELYRRTLGENHESTLRAEARWVQALRMQTKLAEASAAATPLLARAEAVLGPEHEITQQVVTSLQGVLLAQAKFREAEPLLRRSLAASRRTLGDEHINTLSALSNLALVLANLGRFDEAIVLSEESIALRRKVYGPEHPLTLPTMANLAAIYAQTGRLDDAVRLATEVFTLRGRILGAEHPQTLSASDILANILVRAGRRTEAAALFDKSLPVATRVLGPDHAAPLAAAVARADIHLAHGELADADRLADDALARLRKKFGPDHVQTLDALIVHARIRLAQKNWAAADTDLTQALALGERTLGANNPRTVGVRHYLGTLRLAEGKPADAEPLFAAVHAHRLKTAGEAHSETLAAAAGLGEAQLRQGKLDAAETTLLSCHAALDRALSAPGANQGLFAERRTEVRRLLADLYDRRGQGDTAARFRP